MHKISVVKTLFKREDTLSSSATSVHNEPKKILNVLKSNNYPNSFINKVHRRVSHVTSTENPTPQHSTVTPYVKGFSEALKRVLSH